MRIHVHVHADAEAAAAAVADEIARTVRDRPDAVLGLATGGTMEPVYARLIAAHRAGLSFARVTTFNLDEYVGLPPGHPQSYRSTIRRQFLDHVGVDPARSHVPRDDLPPDRAAAEYEAALAAAPPIDVQLLGLGRNGHIGFNEPPSPPGSRTRAVDLSASTVAANARFFAPDEAQPKRAVTMGIATILAARRLLLLAVGTAKADAVRAMIEGPVTDEVPASALRGHGDVTVVLDGAAAAGLAGDVGLTR